MKVCLRIGLLAGFSAALLSADASYTQVTKFTGGTAVEMAKKMANMPLIGRMPICGEIVAPGTTASR